jgi:SagB-type dehydrogenase family enzyme
MSNDDLTVAKKYHEATRHSVWSVRSSRHFLDWDNKPYPYKIYSTLQPIPLPVGLPDSGMPALEAVARQVDFAADRSIPTLDQIAYLLYYSAGVTKKMVYPGEEFHFRAAACAGALYPIEIYLVCADLPGLEAGVYHFAPAQFALHRLRKGDFRGLLARASGDEPAVTGAPVILVYTAITWRSAWKYQARSYRYHYWDNGTIIANTLVACAAQHLPARLVMGFVDAQVTQLLDIDGKWEKSLSLLPVGRMNEPLPPLPDVPQLNLETEPLSADWREYPLIDEIHQSSMLVQAAEVAGWRQAGQAGAKETGKASSSSTQRFPLVAPDLALSSQSLEDTIVRRGSSRRYRRETIPFAEFSMILAASTRGFSAEWLAAGGKFLNVLYLNLHAVGGLPPGSYQYDPEENTLYQLDQGDFRGDSAYLCLEQELGGAASATVFFLADLDSILDRFGNRGYRLVQMEAGILGGKLYLAAYGLGFGASGLTFYDDDVVNFFSPHASGSEAMFVTTIGVPAPPGRRMGRLVITPPGEAVES